MYFTGEINMPKKEEKKEKQPASNYNYVSIPKFLVDKIDDLLKTREDYRSRAEFVNECIRARLKELGYIK